MICQSSVPNMILTVTLNAAIDKRYVVEGYQVGEVNRVKECAYTPGGKGLNVSKPASIAGAEVVATGFVGGHAGNYIESRVNSIIWKKRAEPVSTYGMKLITCRQNFLSRDSRYLRKNLRDSKNISQNW